VVHADGRIVLLDNDELDEALEKGVVSQDQYELALKTAENLMEDIKSNVKILEAFCLKYYWLLGG
jgi:predicted RNA-binding protein associated with RNAse of E/G family